MSHHIEMKRCMLGPLKQKCLESQVVLDPEEILVAVTEQRNHQSEDWIKMAINGEDDSKSTNTKGSSESIADNNADTHLQKQPQENNCQIPSKRSFTRLESKNLEKTCLQDDVLISQNERSKKIRFDNFGNRILKGSESSHKIVFADSPIVEEKNKLLVEIIFVESYKSFNTDMSRSGNNSCCIIS